MISLKLNFSFNNDWVKYLPNFEKDLTIIKVNNIHPRDISPEGQDCFSTIPFITLKIPDYILVLHPPNPINDVGTF